MVNCRLPPRPLPLFLNLSIVLNRFWQRFRETQTEPDGDDVDLISRLNAMAEGAAPPPAAAAPAAVETAAPEPVAVEEVPAPAPVEAAASEVETAEVSGEPLVNQLGGISMVDASIETLFRHLLKDDELKPYFDGLEMMIFQAKMVEYFTSILGGRDKYTGDIQEEFRPLAEQGLSDPHFDKMVACLQSALSELEIDDALASAVVAVFEAPGRRCYAKRRWKPRPPLPLLRLPQRISLTSRMARKKRLSLLFSLSVSMSTCWKT